jgi:enterochelin esterase family protein
MASAARSLNPAVTPNLLSVGTALRPASLPWEVNDVPHGACIHFYKSGVVGDNRDFYVYTPPGYDPTSKTLYPFFVAARLQR